MRRNGKLGSLALCAILLVARLQAKKKAEPEEPSAIDRYVLESTARSPVNHEASAGSVYSTQGQFADLGRDVRANQVDDLVTIVVFDRASALSKGSVATSRKSSTKNSVGVLGPPNPAGALGGLATVSGDTQLSGEGETTRETSLTTTLTTRVTHRLANGNLVVEGVKDVMVNSERQLVTVRGVLRPADLNRDNQIRSDRLAMLEIRVNGKGVVGDAIRRPNILYRILLGILPF
jgi:flagellar L-ring protein precursor FlgH